MEDTLSPMIGIASTKSSSGSVHPRSAVRVAILVGGTISEQSRLDIEQRRRPRLDVLELESAHHAAICDFSILSAGGGQRTQLIRQIAKRTNLWSDGSSSLAFHVLPLIRDIDVVYATGEDVGFPLAALLRARNLTRPHLVVRLEQPTYGRNFLRRTVYAGLIEYAVPRVDRVLCRTTAHLNYLHSLMGVAASNLRLVRETVDTRFFCNSAVDKEAFPAQLPLIVSGGMERRDYLTLIEAVRGLPLNLVIGAGSPWSHASKSELSAVPLPPNVRVSSFSPTEMRALYAAATAIVVPVKPSLRACGMNVVLEGWAMGKPAIATRTAGLLDYIVDGHNGLFVPPYDVAALRSRILYLIDHPELAQQLGHEGRSLVQQDLNLDQYVKRVSTELEEVVGSH